MMMSVEQSVEFLAGETDILGEILPQCRFVQALGVNALGLSLTETYDWLSVSKDER
jgi:hypothetical protein